MNAPTRLTDLSCDPDSVAWVQALRAEGRRRDEAIARLHALLLRAARFEVSRRQGSVPQAARSELDDLAMQSADDALMAVLAKLDRFRGDSRFSTWAYKFALLEAAVKLRRRPWQAREIPLEPEFWPHPASHGSAPEVTVEQAELLAAIGRAIRTDLTAHQREVLIAVAVNGVPIDVLADRFGTTRGALYKTIHDARSKLRGRLVQEGHWSEQAWEGARG